MLRKRNAIALSSALRRLLVAVSVDSIRDGIEDLDAIVGRLLKTLRTSISIEISSSICLMDRSAPCGCQKGQHSQVV